MVTLQLRQLDVPPGQRPLIHDVDWSEFEARYSSKVERSVAALPYVPFAKKFAQPCKPEHYQ